MKLYRTQEGCWVEVDGAWYVSSEFSFNELFLAEAPRDWLGARLTRFRKGQKLEPHARLLAPLEDQEVWAAGVTYRRSREARMEESADVAADIYDRVYGAERPEIFFKATSSRVVGSGQAVRIRSDSTWNVPEPELTLAINRQGNVFGYTIGNDMSSRSIEGENPLYLPQAKTYLASCALGPGLYLAPSLAASTEIHMQVRRDEEIVVDGSVSLTQMKRSFDELVEYLFRDNLFVNGCYLMTGTGLVPESDFTLRQGDEISITVEPIGTLTNRVGQAP